MAFQDRSVEFSSCCLPLSRAQLKLKGKHKTPFLSHSLVEKNRGGFKGGREMSRFQVPCAISTNLLKGESPRT